MKLRALLLIGLLALTGVLSGCMPSCRPCDVPDPCDPCAGRAR